jgi:hypothetical protein
MEASSEERGEHGLDPDSQSNDLDARLNRILHELKQIDDPDFTGALMEHLETLSLHRKGSPSFEDIDRLFTLAFRYANTSLKEKESTRY